MQDGRGNLLPAGFWKKQATISQLRDCGFPQSQIKQLKKALPIWKTGMTMTIFIVQLLQGQKQTGWWEWMVPELSPVNTTPSFPVAGCRPPPLPWSQSAKKKSANLFQRNIMVFLWKPRMWNGPGEMRKQRASVLFPGKGQSRSKAGWRTMLLK